MERLTYLFKQFTNKKATYAERLEFQDLLQTSHHDTLLKKLIDEHFEQHHVQAVDLLSSDKMMKQILSTAEKARHKTSPIKLWHKLAITACLTLALILGGSYYFNQFNKKVTGKLFSYKNDIPPGKKGATLTLGNGKVILLTDKINGKLAEEAGVVISKTADGMLQYQMKYNTNENKLNTLRTGPGETFSIKLPDGTIAWLNAASSLTFNTHLTESGKRKVNLLGEGYFEVAKDKLHPFIVTTENQEIEVLGTHFNVNSYTDESIKKTTLIEGSVKINLKNGQHYILHPGEQAQQNRNQISISEVDTELVTAWKNNKFWFESAPIQDIMKMIARWYNVEIIYDGEIPQYKFGGSVSRFENVSKVLQILESTQKVHFEIEGRRIFVRK